MCDRCDTLRDRCRAPRVAAALRSSAARFIGLLLIAVPLIGEAVPAPAGESSRPSVLIHCARSALAQWHWWVDLQYLSELHAGGFEVDYTDVHSDLTWERIRQYDVLVIYVTPLEDGKYFDNTPNRPPYRDEFVELVERFLDHGGGVFLMARALNADETFRPLIERWGVRIPHERIEEDDPDRLVVTPRMGGKQRLWFSDRVMPSAVSEGVEQVWLPLTRHYSAMETMPIQVSADWQVVLTGSKSSRTVPIETSDERILPPPDPVRRSHPEDPPDLFAIRSYGRGRIAMCAIWPHYSIGQGTAWLYGRRVLSEGVDGRPSHFGRLVENTLAWLATAADNEVGGYVTDPTRLIPPNQRPGIRQAFLTRQRSAADDGPQRLERAVNRTRLYHGLIGARTARGGGKGDVARYAAAARSAGLDFVVFLEPLDALGPGDLARSREECREQSDDGLQLFAGYRMESNTGNRVFVFGPQVERPPAELLIDGRLNQQPQDPTDGAFIDRWPVLIDWVTNRVIPSQQANIGYFGFSDRPSAQRIVDLRLYAMVAVEFFRNGKRVEDNLQDYLSSAAGTIPAVPVSVHLVDSPAQLRRAVSRGVGLTHVGAESRARLWDALRYSGQYDAPNVFPSGGPEIVVWPEVHQYYTLGAEDFAGGAAYIPAPLVVRSETGLREIRIYDGERLFRRFDGAGRTEFSVVLELPASIQRTLTVVVEDVTGGRAISTARRNWKGGELAPVFCGDRINHCDSKPLLAKGPGAFRVLSTPVIEAGATWDGGPRGARPLVSPKRALRPRLIGDLGQEGERGFANVPRLVLADEGAVRVRSTLDRTFSREIPVTNAWRTFGPLADRSHLLRAEQYFTHFDRPTRGVDPYHYPGFARRGGATVSLFESDVTFLADQTVDRLELFVAPGVGELQSVHVLHGRDSRVLTRYELRVGQPLPEGPRLETGDWVAFYADGAFNPSVQFNRGTAIQLDFSSGRGVVYRDAGQGFTVSEGDRRHYELLSFVDPLDAVGRGEGRVTQIVRFLLHPTGAAKDPHRSPAVSPWAGLLDLQADGGAVSVAVPWSEHANQVPLPLRVGGLNPNWSAGVFLQQGYVLGHYGAGNNRYRAAGIDPEGRLYTALFPDLADQTRVVLGHPLVCDHDELFLQVTLARDIPGENAWHVSINNPTDQPLTTTVRLAIPMPGLAAYPREVTVPAGGYLVLQ